uniref:Uncharacterized protein n=1 Tax=Anguilla anguilla TaxID=7936 RepID=A0A0E9W1M2_ANGAN
MIFFFPFLYFVFYAWKKKMFDLCNKNVIKKSICK